jgi:hypothetical protein
MNGVNQELQSLITAGKIKKMELMSINNRAQFNHGKVQRCEWLTNRYPLGASQFLPDLKGINLNNCTEHRKTGHQRRKTDHQKEGSPESSGSRDEKIVNDLIDGEVERIRRGGELKQGRDRDSLVREACRNIREKLMLTHKNAG